MSEVTFREALSRALKTIDDAEEDCVDARLTLAARKAALDKARAAKVELECEFLGRSKTPLIELAEARGRAAVKEEVRYARTVPGSDETAPVPACVADLMRRREADDRQRGTTTIQAETDDLDDPSPFPEWTQAEVEEELRTALHPEHLAESPWSAFRAAGAISRREIEDTLRHIWPADWLFTSNPGGPGHTTYGGALPVFWMGDKTGRRPKPLGLDGDKLYDAVRKILRIPEPSGAPRLPGAAETPPGKRAESGRADVSLKMDGDALQPRPGPKPPRRTGKAHPKPAAVAD